MVVSLNIDNYDVRRILVDNESLVDILFYNAFSKLDIFSDQLNRLDSPLRGFIEDAILIEGIIILPFMVGQEPR